MEKLINAQQAAELLGYSVKYLRRLCTQGKIRHIQNGSRGHLRFKQEWIDAFLQQNEVTHVERRGELKILSWDDDLRLVSDQ